jgi:hypothetical protein
LTDRGISAGWSILFNVTFITVSPKETEYLKSDTSSYLHTTVHKLWVSGKLVFDVPILPRIDIRAPNWKPPEAPRWWPV